jgi:hypothetical protein
MAKRILLSIVVLIAVVVIGAAVAIPRLAGSDTARDRIAKTVRRATGRDFAWAKLDVRLVPPRLVLHESRLAGATPEEPAFAEARAISLRLAVLPLFVGAVVVDSLELEGATVRLIRTEDGIAWPRPPKKEPAPPKEPSAEPGPRKPRPRGEPQMAVRSVELRDVHVLLDDRAVEPPVVWDLSGVSGRARAEDWQGNAIRIDLSGRLAPAGVISAAGYASVDRSLDVCLDLSGVALAPFRAYLPDGRDLAGALSGRIRLRGAAGTRGRLGLAGTVEAAVLELDEIRADGDVAIDADLVGPPYEGRFHIDATAAEFDAGGSVGFTKPAGLAAIAAGQLVPEADGYGVDGVQVDIGGTVDPEAAFDPCAAADPS